MPPRRGTALRLLGVAGRGRALDRPLGLRSAGGRIACLDGLALYGPQDEAAYALPDSLHPDDRLYDEMGRRFAQFVFGDAGLVPSRTDPVET